MYVLYNHALYMAYLGKVCWSPCGVPLGMSDGGDLGVYVHLAIPAGRLQMAPVPLHVPAPSWSSNPHTMGVYIGSFTPYMHFVSSPSLPNPAALAARPAGVCPEPQCLL